MRGWKKIFHANGNQKKAGGAILISNTIVFKTKTTTRDKEEHYIMINPRRRYNNCKYLCTNIGAPQYITQMLAAIKGKNNSNTIKVGDFHQWTDHPK